MTSTESYTAAAGQARKATANTLQAWTTGAKAISDQVGATALPKIDLLQPVKSYFQLVQQTIELNQALASTWTGLFTSLSGSVGEHTNKVVHAAADQAEKAVDDAETVVDLAAKQAAKAATEQARLARQAERAAAKEAKAKAREPYEGLPKAELSEQLAARGLPKTGTIEQLIERLVSADSK